MAKDFAKDFYNSRAWRSARAAYAKSVRGLCEDCLRKGLYTAGEIVHHREMLTAENINDPNITLGWSNLKLVCRECHAEEHKTNTKPYYFDEQGNVCRR